MGQIFTFTAIQCGHVPQLNDFTAVVDLLRRQLPQEPSILGALVCGSVVRGDHNVRSDIDCFVLYDHMREHEAFAFMQGATALASSLHVPLGFVPCDTRLAQTRMHHVGTSFRRHLERSVLALGLLKGSPLSGIVENLPEHDELESYLRVKMYNLQESWAQALTFSEECVTTYLRKLLEAPMHVARKVLARMGQLEGDSKAFIRSRYAEVMPTEMVSQLEYLLCQDEHYTEVLLAQIENPTEQAYRATLEDLLQSSERVLEFIRLNLAFIAATAR